ncbi:Cro/CI family transcriptional regulator [Paraburkholderia caribensis]|uniref:Cro/CI family transcriptional regulator n=1 Tax=Paraburkholderia caribensis TaxID=75105 RepID=UPI00072107FB|nr:Cro/CI family transcriptional regulator [Paraburkholderia caribensis]ALP62382.1 hypothetical protein AN416_07065 [Paraburkholderia caribensis]AUT52392.1 hypothetical protein C2L66_11360 [Paraburkholderia caribensis]
MTKSELINRAGGVARLAKLLCVSSQAVSKWPDAGIPPLRLYQLRDLKPEWFAGRMEHGASLNPTLNTVNNQEG